MRCFVCNTEFDGKICPTCGASMEFMHEYLEQREPSPRRGFNGVKGVIALALVVALVATGMYFFKKFPVSAQVATAINTYKSEYESKQEAKAKTTQSTTLKTEKSTSTTAKATTTTTTTTTTQSTTEATTTTKATIATTTTKVKSTGVSKSFKKQMDNYEAFFTEYVAFMKEYSKDSDDLDMMEKYVDFAREYEKQMDSMNSVDVKNISDDDFQYFTKVYNRINRQLNELK